MQSRLERQRNHDVPPNRSTQEPNHATGDLGEPSTPRILQDLEASSSSLSQEETQFSKQRTNNSSDDSSSAQTVIQVEDRPAAHSRPFTRTYNNDDDSSSAQTVIQVEDRPAAQSRHPTPTRTFMIGVSQPNQNSKWKEMKKILYQGLFLIVCIVSTLGIAETLIMLDEDNVNLYTDYLLDVILKVSMVIIIPQRLLSNPAMREFAWDTVIDFYEACRQL